jgi:RNase P subunit RPR2
VGRIDEALRLSPKVPDAFAPDKILAFHERQLEGMGLPRQVRRLKCVTCRTRLSAAAIRGVGLKTNAQHLGNVTVEICCTRCHSGYELHFYAGCKTLRQFCHQMLHGRIPGEAVPMHQIPVSRNNLMEKMTRAEVKKGSRPPVRK